MRSRFPQLARAMGEGEGMNAAELTALNELLDSECGWRVEIGRYADGGEFFRVFSTVLNEARADIDTFVGVMPICTTGGAFVSTGALCQHYYLKGLSVRDASKVEAPAPG
ncbi:hypothetical protein ACU683_14190 [Pseudomonas salmasensis]